MDAVGARLGRSSTRYSGPTTVFTGPVRKWKKRWVCASPLTASKNHHRSILRNGTSNGSNLLFFKWTLFSQNNSAAHHSGSDVEKTPTKDAAVAGDELPRRKFKFIPIAMLEEQTNEASERAEDEATPFHSSKRKDFSEKPDINRMPMEETQGPAYQFQRQDLNKSTFDLSLA